ncbi:MAG: RidA family protein [Thermoanaerobaculia bacterium]|nr:RidA family protein [Thermoanaerobaculia bacterium]
MKLTSFNARSAPQPAGGYSQAVAVDGARRLLFISGQVPESLEGELPADFKSQAELAWFNVCAQLTAAEMSVSNLVKVTMFLSSREHAVENSKVRAAVLGVHEPALTVIITGIYDERWLLEIEAVAAS